MLLNSPLQHDSATNSEEETLAEVSAKNTCRNLSASAIRWHCPRLYQANGVSDYRASGSYLVERAGVLRMCGMRMMMRKWIKEVMPWRASKDLSPRMLVETVLRVALSRICLVKTST